MAEFTNPPDFRFFQPLTPECWLPRGSCNMPYTLKPKSGYFKIRCRSTILRELRFPYFQNSLFSFKLCHRIRITVFFSNHIPYPTTLTSFYWVKAGFSKRAK